MASPLLFVTQKQIESRLSVRRVERVFDDNNDGTPDNGPILQLRRDASSRVAAYLEPIGLIAKIRPLFVVATGELIDPTTSLHPEVTRLTLDMVHAMACQRHPLIFQMDWQPLMKQVCDELTDIRMGKTSLGEELPQAANQGTYLSANGPAEQRCEPIGLFWSDFGDFAP